MLYCPQVGVTLVNSNFPGASFAGKSAGTTGLSPVVVGLESNFTVEKFSVEYDFYDLNVCLHLRS